jgi:hypothetical protein
MLALPEIVGVVADVARMVTAPGDSAVMSPADETEATTSLLELHVTAVLAPLVTCTVAVAVAVPPTVSVAGAVTVTDTTVGVGGGVGVVGALGLSPPPQATRANSSGSSALLLNMTA